jgi:hypothetical protein
MFLVEIGRIALAYIPKALINSNEISEQSGSRSLATKDKRYASIPRWEQQCVNKRP